MSEAADPGSRFVNRMKGVGQIGLLSLLILTVTGCGDNGSGSLATSDQPTATTVGDPESTTASTGTNSTGPATGQHDGEGQDSEFCEWILGNVADDTNFSDPAATRASMTQNLAEADQFRSNLPDTIAADFEVVYQQMIATEAAFAENGYDLFRIPDGVLEALSTDEVVEASSNISDYCGAGL